MQRQKEASQGWGQEGEWGVAEKRFRGDLGVMEVFWNLTEAGAVCFCDYSNHLTE